MKHQRTQGKVAAKMQHKAKVYRQIINDKKTVKELQKEIQDSLYFHQLEAISHA